jgi:DNA modification methylase
MTTFNPWDIPIDFEQLWQLYKRVIKPNDLIRTYTSPGAVVLDNACGCGSFLIAAIREGRKFISIEKNIGAYHQKNKPIDFIEIALIWIAAEPLPTGNFILENTK